MQLHCVQYHTWFTAVRLRSFSTFFCVPSNFFLWHGRATYATATVAELLVA